MSSVATSCVRVEEVRARGHADGALSIHPYFGRVDPALAHALIERYAEAGARVLDPFCGSGTVLHEAVRLGRRATGWDSSLLAVAITLGKLSCPSLRETTAARSFADDFVARFADLGGGRRDLVRHLVPEMPRIRSVDSWFGATALRELSAIRNHLLASDGDLPLVSRLLCWLAFSRIITKASNQQGESTYRRISKNHAAGAINEMYVRAVDAVCTAAAALVPVLGDRELTRLALDGGHFGWAGVGVEVAVRDSRLPDNDADKRHPADLVITSPPYLMSWDYGLYHKFRFYWLGIDLDAYEETEIGRHLRRQKDDVARYRDDMTRTFAALRGAVKRDGLIALVNSPSVVYGELVDTNAVLAECGAVVGWALEECRPSLTLTGPHHGMYASLDPRGASAPGASGKQEHVLVFRRAAD
jgi:DNA methylase